MNSLRVALAAMFLAAAGPGRAAPPRLVVWAWERPEDLRFLRGDTEVAVQTGFVDLTGDRVEARGRRFALLADPARVTISVVHVQIDPRQPLLWSAAMRAKTAEAVLRFAEARGTPWIQIDFEVRASQRHILLDLLNDVRAGLPPNTRLAMTALASWCDTETWLAAAPVDEIAPMLFRMGSSGEALKARLADGGDFAEPRCRKALAVSTDAPILRAPASGRRVYLFASRSWRASEYDALRTRIGLWGGG